MDALIGEVAKNNDLILVTEDKTFKKKALLLNIKVFSFDEFLM